MGWRPPWVKQWTSILRHWSRCTKMHQNRINFKIVSWSIRKANCKIKNWSYNVMEMFKMYEYEN